MSNAISRGAPRRLALAALVCAPLLLLAACGGGGGGGGGTLGGGDVTNGPGTDPGTSPGSGGSVNGGTLAISSGNARAVAADALANAANVELGSTANFASGVQVSDASSAGAGTLQVVRAARVLLAKAGSVRPLATGVVVDFPLDCARGGTLNMHITQATPDLFVAGDSIVFTATACKENVSGVDFEMSGRLTLTMVSGRVDTSAEGSQNFPNRFVETLKAENWSTTSRGQTVVTNGDMTADVDQHTADTDTVIITGTALAGTVTTSRGTRSFALRNFRQTFDFSAGTTIFTVDASLESTNSLLGGGTQTYTVSTPTALRMEGGLRTGVMLVTGSGSALRLTVTALETFLVEVDANGDGTFESSSTATRNELDALL